MEHAALDAAFKGLTTPHVADACLRADVPYEVAPPGMRSVVRGASVAGRALPCRHFGSVDVFFEAMTHAGPGDVLVIDNDARDDEGCIGDLTVLEAMQFHIGALVVWGCHRDTAELVRIGHPVWSLGSVPTGPRRLDAQTKDALDHADVGRIRVTRDTAVFADDDGVLFAPLAKMGPVLEAARAIATRERKQADDVRRGKTMHDQLRFAEYLERRKKDPRYSFRAHLKGHGGAIEE